MEVQLGLQKTYDIVTNGYSTVAKQGTTDAYAQRVATAFGYTSDQLASIPRGSNMGLSCGNPVALAGIKEGETVLDLGSGGGFDVFLAAEKVGASGKAIGVDMNADMIALAQRNAASSPLSFRVEFLHSKITSLPVSSGSVDCIISNCVINLVPDAEKATVFKEMGRALKAGGRVAVSDILAKKELPARIRRDAGMLVGCIAGASTVVEYTRWLEDAGFAGVVIVDTQKDVNVYKHTDEEGGVAAVSSGCCSRPVPGLSSGCCSRPEPEKSEDLRLDYDLNEWVGSFQIYAVKSAKNESAA